MNNIKLSVVPALIQLLYHLIGLGKMIKNRVRIQRVKKEEAFFDEKKGNGSNNTRFCRESQVHLYMETINE